MSRENVVDQTIRRPSRHVVVGGDGRQRTQRAFDHLRIDRGALARLNHRPSSAAAEVDAKLFEDTRGSEVGGDDFANGGSFE
jgi:hypothetical protein